MAKPADGSETLAMAQIHWHRTVLCRDDPVSVMPVWYVSVSDLDRPFCYPKCMASSTSPMHHQMIMASSAVPVGGDLAGGSCRHPEQGLRPGVHLEAGRPRPGQGRGQLLHPGKRNRERTTRPLVGTTRRPSVLSLASGSSASRMSCCSANAGAGGARARRRPIPAGKPQTSTSCCWPLSRTPPPNVNANCGPRPSRRPAKAPLLRLDDLAVQEHLDLPRFSGRNARLARRRRGRGRQTGTGPP